MTPGVRAQTEAPNTPDPQPEASAGLQAPFLDGSHAAEAQQVAEQWVKTAIVTGSTRTMPVTGLFAVRVTLRMSGLTVGTGDVYRPDMDDLKDGPGAPVDLFDLLSKATGGALDQLRETLADAKRRAAMSMGANNPAATARTPLEVTDQLLVGIQLAHQLQPVKLPSDAKPEAVLGTFVPGFHGLRVIASDGAKGAFRWPATALASNISPHSQLVGLLSEQNRPPDDLARLGRPGGPVLQRFEVIYVVRPTAGLPPTRLVRGNVVLPPHPVSERTLRNMANRLSAHLDQRFTDWGTLRGTYHPTRMRYDPYIASDQETALTCYALIRQFRHRLQSRSWDSSLLNRAEITRNIAVNMIRARFDENESLSPAATAWVLLTLTDDPLPDKNRALRDRLGRLLLELYDGKGSFRVAPRQDARSLNQVTNALITAALAALYEQTRNPQTGTVVGEALDSLWADSDGRPNVATLPWYVMAHSRAAHLLAANSAPLQARLRQREKALGDLVKLLSEQQIIGRPKLGPSDVMGGFELTPGPPKSALNPDWRTAQLLAFLAICLRQDGIRAVGDVYGWTLTVGLAARFIGQLMIDEPHCYYVRSPSEVLGGVRRTLWDNRLLVAPTALSLLAVTELQETLLESSTPHPQKTLNPPHPEP